MSPAPLRVALALGTSLLALDAAQAQATNTRPIGTQRDVARRNAPSKK